MSIGVLLRQSIHELAAAYEIACEEYGEDSERALQIADALEFMRRWMRRYSDDVRLAQTLVWPQPWSVRD